MMQRFVLHPDASRERVLANAHAALDNLPDKGAWQVEIKRKVKRRSKDQNEYLWAVCYKILEDSTGQEAKDWHEYFLGEHFGWEEHDMLGKRKLKPRRRSSGLSTMEFWDFVAFIQRRAGENGIFIPDPDPLWKEKVA